MPSDDRDDGAATATRRLVGLISCGRAGVGAALLLAPRLSLRLLGFPDSEVSSAARYLGRLAAVRELAVAAAALAELRGGGRPRPPTLMLNLACDASDAAVLALSAPRRRTPRRALALGGPTALAVSLIWVWLLRREVAAA